MPKSMRQPTRDDDAQYFTDYAKDQVSKLEVEMERINKRLAKLNSASELYLEMFGKKLNLDN
jgi:hypothetical protein